VLKPLIKQEELPWTSEMLGEGSEFTYNNDALAFGIHGSRAVGPGEWHYAARVLLS